MAGPNRTIETKLAERFEDLRREIQKGIDSSERGDVLRFSSGEELAAHIEAQGRRILAERKALKSQMLDTAL